MGCKSTSLVRKTRSMEEGEGMSLMVRYSGDGVPKSVMGDQDEPGSSYNLRSGWYLSELR